MFDFSPEPPQLPATSSFVAFKSGFAPEELKDRMKDNRKELLVRSMVWTLRRKRNRDDFASCLSSWRSALRASKQVSPRVSRNSPMGIEQDGPRLLRLGGLGATAGLCTLAHNYCSSVASTAWQGLGRRFAKCSLTNRQRSDYSPVRDANQDENLYSHLDAATSPSPARPTSPPCTPGGTNKGEDEQPETPDSSTRLVGKAGRPGQGLARVLIR